MPVTTDFAGTETLAETKSRLGTLLTAYGYDSSGYSTWGDARTDLNSALTAIEETTISDGELASSFRSKLNALNAWSDYPAGGKVPNLVFDFEGDFYRANDTETTFGDSITFSRASSATYVDSDGVLQTAASGVPRIGHHVWNGSAWVNEGLLHESEARTNLITYSEDFTDASWSATNVTATGNTTGPDGQANSAFTVSATSDFGRLSTAAIGPLTGTYCLSVFVKKKSVSSIFALAFSNVGSDDEFSIDLVDGSSSSTGVNVSNVRVEEFNDFWRVSATKTFSAANANVRIFGGYPTNIDPEVFGAQFEAGSTPSSYIPTSGSTVTRAAETLTIPSAKLPWPTPNVIGPELVTNGTFDTDSDWTKGAGWTISGGQASHVAGSATLLYQLISLTLGKVYKATCDVVSVSGGTGSLQFRSGGTTTVVTLDASQAGTTVELLYVAEGNTQIAVFAGSGTNITIDNISVREIDPLAVSIQMQGEIDYVGDGDNATATFVRRQAVSGQYIQKRLRTDSTRTGASYALMNNGVATIGQDTNGAVADLSAGINVPFNTASRFGSTFLNVALDGVAASALSTPTALPDLSTTDLSLGYDYMGTIRTFRMWDQDLGDSGIEEASA